MRPDVCSAGDAGDYEWVNAWWLNEEARADETAAASNAADRAVGAAPQRDGAERKAGNGQARSVFTPPVAAIRLSKPIPDDQLMRDIAEIERARDAVAATYVPAQRLQAFMLVPSRTTDSVPIFIGGVMALVMLTVFGAAAALTKVGR